MANSEELVNDDKTLGSGEAVKIKKKLMALILEYAEESQTRISFDE